MPKRIQMSRQHPWRADNPDAVIVARPSKWGNSHTVGAEHIWITSDRFGAILHRQKITRALAADLYLRDIQDMVLGAPDIRDIIRELAGRDLACWCPLSEPCHVDVLLELANT